MKAFIIVGVLLATALVEGTFIPNLSNKHLGRNERIIGGLTAADKQFPYQVYLSINVGVMARTCGGSLISPQFVMTSSMCLVDGTLVKVTLGSVNKNDPYLYITTDKFVQHPQFVYKTRDNDIGLVDLQQNVPLSDRVQVIALPRFSQITETFTNEKAVVTGWGYVSVGTPSSQFLKYANLTVIPNDDCQGYVGSVIDDHTICATKIEGQLQTPCSSDDGGALVWLDTTDNTLVQIGIISNDCNQNGQISRYIRPENYWRFISSYTGIPIRE